MASGLSLQKIARHDLIFEKYVDGFGFYTSFRRKCSNVETIPVGIHTEA